jgi:hypothetical protein
MAGLRGLAVDTHGGARRWSQSSRFMAPVTTAPRGGSTGKSPGSIDDGEGGPTGRTQHNERRKRR